MRYDVIVVGAGIVGTSIAWHLQKNNAQVLLLDKKPPGEETSYGNAGIITREAINTKPFPRSVKEIFSVLPNNRTDIRYRCSAIYGFQRSLFQYWQYSCAKNIEVIDKEWVTLIEHCTNEHEPMIKAAGAEALVSKIGWIELHRHSIDFEKAISKAVKAAEQGVEYQVLSLVALQALEPNLNFTDYIGGIHWKNSWQIKNPSSLVKAYAKSFAAMAGQVKQSTVTDIMQTAEGWQVVCGDDTYVCQHVVIAAGPWSAELIKPLGYNIPMFPMRGYHQHFKITPKNALSHSLFDVDKGFVMGAMEQGIRVTTGAEMANLDAPKKFDQLEAVLTHARKLAPLEDAVEAKAWCGTRPCMPDMKPVIGRASKHDNLWFAFGHAHQGLTLGPVTGRLIEEMIHNKPLFIDAKPFSSHRFAANL
ncbi:NAD(P)/FAD-dependent oxidoreductase [Psychrobacter communis]|uniref:FAD-binding oxidoreductase n=1 Tax=Psychrobacter communis TaxID=2762238 RepID=A0ABR8RKP1_9GAMM|nr:FAD-binding oxidoreductase [Psychrobacter communis]MBD7948237.1 FAD-binding oxidoreductase [Psychrobacter communis]